MFELVSFLGGIFLIIGALFLATGNVFLSVFFYFIADVCWVLMAVSQGAWFSVISIVVGMSAGLYVWWKMNRGEFRKSIKKDHEISK